jgi:3',5'-cyclic AMP phosphodiesterase CpdA
LRVAIRLREVYALSRCAAPRISSGEVFLTESFTIGHVSDLHLPPTPWPGGDEFALKRSLGFLNWKRARERLSDKTGLDRLVADLKALKPDHIAVTGDITNLALRSEQLAAADWLRGLGSPADVSFVPGNHDAYVRQAVPHLLKSFAPWTAGDRPSTAPTPFPWLRVRGFVAIIGVNTGVPTGLFMATGRAGDEQVAAFRRLLAETRREGLIRAVLIHHAPVPGMAVMRRLVDAGDVASALVDEGAEIVLHGHHHKRMTHFLESRATRTPGGRIPIIGAPSASTRLRDPSHRAAYTFVRVDRSDGKIDVTARMRGPAVDSNKIEELPPPF